MVQVFGEELKKQIQERKDSYKASIGNRIDRINKGWTDMDDCFVSQRFEEQGIYECDLQLQILNGDGMMDCKVVVDQDDKEVYTHWFTNKWGGWSVVAKGVFASSIKALCKKTGWTEKTIRVPCWTKFVCGVGGGMCSAYTGHYDIVRWHTNMLTGEYVGYPTWEGNQQ